MNNKATLRRKMLEVQRRMSPSIKKKADVIITKVLLARPEIKHAKTICIYESYPSEVDTLELIRALRKQKKIVVPPEPAPQNVDVFVVPGVAFDKNGFRLGRGGGYYDRLLVGVDVPIIGLAYKCQIVSRLPREKYDIPVSIVIHE